MATRSTLEPILREMSITALRAASASHGRHEVFVSNHFPAFNIRRLWRLTGGLYLRRVLDGLARRSRNRRLLCFFQVQTLDGPDFWQPRGTEVRAERRRVELSHSPLHAYADVMDGWGPRWEGKSWWNSGSSRAVCSGGGFLLQLRKGG